MDGVTLAARVPDPPSAAEITENAGENGRSAGIGRCARTRNSVAPTVRTI
jgi:hypothetical protein